MVLLYYLFKVKGVKGNFSFEEFPCYLYPFDNDVMSLELESAFKVNRVHFLFFIYTFKSKSVTLSTKLSRKFIVNF